MIERGELLGHDALLGFAVGGRSSLGGRGASPLGLGALPPCATPLFCSPFGVRRLREAVASFGSSPAILRKRRRVMGATPGSVAAAESGADGAASAPIEPQSVGGGGPFFDDLLCSPSPQSQGLQGRQLLTLLDGAAAAPSAPGEGVAALTLTPFTGAFTPLPCGGAAPSESLTAQLASGDVRLSLAGSVGGGAGSIKPQSHRLVAGKIVPLDLDGLLSPRTAEGSLAQPGGRTWRASNNRVSGFFQRRPIPASKVGLAFDRVASAPPPGAGAGAADGADSDVLVVMRAVAESHAALYAHAEALRRSGVGSPAGASDDRLKENVLSLGDASAGGVQLTPQAGSKYFSGLGFSPYAGSLMGGPSPTDTSGTPADPLRIAGELGLTDGTPSWTVRMCR